MYGITDLMASFLNFFLMEYHNPKPYFRAISLTKYKQHGLLITLFAVQLVSFCKIAKAVKIKS